MPKRKRSTSTPGGDGSFKAGEECEILINGKKLKGVFDGKVFKATQNEDTGSGASKPAPATRKSARKASAAQNAPKSGQQKDNQAGGASSSSSGHQATPRSAGGASQNRQNGTQRQTGQQPAAATAPPQPTRKHPAAATGTPPPPAAAAAVPPSDSASGNWRVQGNGHYKAALGRTLTSERRGDLDKALTAYHRAYQLAAAVDETTSAAKNLAMANWKMGEALEALDERVKVRRFYYHEAVKYFSIGVARGDGVKPQTWVDALLQSYDACLQDAITKSSVIKTMTERVSDLEKLVHIMEDETYKAEVYMAVGQVVFNASVTSLESGDFRRVLGLLRDCYRPVEEARRHARGRAHILGDVSVLEQDIHLHQATAESMQARHQGDVLFDEVLLQEEDLNMDMVYEVIDWYKKAVILTREGEVEQEAQALSRLGRVYDKVLKNKEKAKTNFMRCMQLALSMHPRTFHSQSWFQVCQEALERYQQEVTAREDLAWQKEREAFLKELAAELKLLKEKSKLNDKEFLIFVYKDFPPKRKSHRIENLDKLLQCQYKKALQKAVTHFHPDRVNVKEWGKKYKVLCEEICKELTRRYEGRKG